PEQLFSSLVFLEHRQGAATQRSHFRLAQCGERGAVQVVLLHGRSRVDGETDSLIPAGTARLAAAPAIPLHRCNTKPSVHLARRMRPRGGSCDGNVAWRGGLANCRNSRHGHSSGKAGDEPKAYPVSRTLHTQEYEAEQD